MNSDPLLYKLSNAHLPTETLLHECYEAQYWRPSIRSWKPPGKGWKYTIYTLFYFCKIFKNDNYQAVLIRSCKSNEIVASLLIVPAYYKWKFMKNSDVQLTYVLVNKNYRGKGFGKVILAFALKSLVNLQGGVWYVTTDENLKSQKLAERSGFVFQRYGRRCAFKIIN